MINYFLLALVSLFIYLPSILFFFVGDDFANLTAKLQEIIFILPSHNHYFPVSWLILFFSHKVFQTNSYLYHLLVIGIFSVNVLLVYKVAGWFFTKKKWQFLAAVFFAFFFANYEVVFWISVIFINSSLTFYLLGFDVFARYLETRKNKDFLLFIVFSLLSIFAMEFGVSLVFLCFFYMLFKKQKIHLKKIINYFFVPLAVFGFISLLKIKTLVINASSSPITFWKWFVSLATFLTHSFYPNPFFWEIFYLARKDFLKLFVLSIPVLVIAGFVVFNLKKIRGVKLPLAIIFANSLMISFTSWAQMRYFYFLAFPSAMFWTMILKKIKNKILIILTTLILIIPQYFFIVQRYFDWQKASVLSRKLVASLTADKGCSYLKKNTFPAWIGDDRYKAYVVAHPQKIMELFFQKTCP